MCVWVGGCVYHRDMASAGVANASVPLRVTKNWVKSRLDLGCQHHTSGAVNEFLRVPITAPGTMPNAFGHIASA